MLKKTISSGSVLLTTIALFACPTGRALAQEFPWVTFTDAPVSESVCDVINTLNSELVLLADSEQLVIVTGPDVILEDTFVDANNNVYVESQPAGFIEFAEDDDGFRSLWWVTLTGRVVTLDGFSGLPQESEFFPDELGDAGCDACNFWDDPSVCAGVPGPNDPIGDGGLGEAIFQILCGGNMAATLSLSLLGLTGLRLRRRR